MLLCEEDYSLLPLWVTINMHAENGLETIFSLVLCICFSINVSVGLFFVCLIFFLLNLSFFLFFITAYIFSLIASKRSSYTNIMNIKHDQHLVKKRKITGS